MPDTRLCSNCGAEIPVGSAANHCIACLLRLAVENEDFATAPSSAPTATVVVPDLPRQRSSLAYSDVGEISDYQIVDALGSGGMGAVYKARQTSLHRLVALKLIKPGMDSGQVLARFEAERQALALMDHPHIARVYDAGRTSLGRPYFVMELVDGIPVTRFCDEHRLNIRERLELFAAICQAIQHAHQKGIVHRDIKPGNVLIAMQDGKPAPKVIDFGVAKALGPSLTEASVNTELGAVIGTLEYMSPEQAEFNQLDIDTRADIYALGVLLYELLAGTTPLNRKQLKTAAFDEVLRRIREDDPPKPSARLGENPELLETIAERRNSPPARLTRQLEGDVDWIVMKALEKDRDRRYETADNFARDIRRHLQDEPVLAGPPTTRYRVGKFVRRHRRAVALAGASVFLLTAATVVSVALAVWASREKNRATKAEVHASTVLGFFQDKVLAAARPQDESGGLGYNVSLQTALEAAEAAIGDTFKDNPNTEASIRDVLGNTAIARGNYSDAVTQHARALALRIKLQGEFDPATVICACNLASAYRLAGRPNDALTLLEKTRDAAKGNPGKLNPSHPLFEILAAVYLDCARYDEAAQFQADILAHRRATRGPDDPETLTSLNNLAVAYRDADQLDKAIPLFEEALQRRKARLTPEHPRTLSSMVNLGHAYLKADRQKEALPLLESASQLQKTKLGPDHPNTLETMGILAQAYHKGGRRNEALELFEETLRGQRVKPGTNHHQTLITMNNLAEAYRSANRLQAALPLCEEALMLRQKHLVTGHPATLVTMNNLGLIQQGLGRLDEAIHLLETALQSQKGNPGPNHADTLTTMNNLAGAYSQAGRRDQAVPLYEETLKLRTARFDRDHPAIIESKNNLGNAYRNAGRWNDALPLLEQALEGMIARSGSTNDKAIIAMNNLALARMDAGQIDKALPLFEESLRLGRTTFSPRHPTLIRFLENNIDANKAAKRWSQVVALSEDIREQWEAAEGPAGSNTVRAAVSVAKVYEDAGQYMEAARAWQQLIPRLKACVGEDHIQVADASLRLGSNLLAAGEKDAAESAVRNALQLLKSKHPGRSLIYEAESLWGAILTAQEKYAEAEAFLTKAYEAVQPHQNDKTARFLNQAAQRLVRLYTSWGKPEQADRWRARMQSTTNAPPPRP